MKIGQSVKVLQGLTKVLITFRVLSHFLDRVVKVLRGLSYLQEFYVDQIYFYLKNL